MSGRDGCCGALYASGISELTLSAAINVAARLTDVRHRLGVAIYANGPSSWAAAVVDAKNSDVLAWDGWYGDDLAAEHREPSRPWTGTAGMTCRASSC